MPESPKSPSRRNTRGIRRDYRALNNGDETIDTLLPLPPPDIAVSTTGEAISTTEFEFELPDIPSNSNSQSIILPSDSISQILPISTPELSTPLLATKTRARDRSWVFNHFEITELDELYTPKGLTIQRVNRRLRCKRCQFSILDSKRQGTTNLSTGTNDIRGSNP